MWYSSNSSIKAARNYKPHKIRGNALPPFLASPVNGSFVRSKMKRVVTKTDPCAAPRTVRPFFIPSSHSRATKVGLYITEIRINTKSFRQRALKMNEEKTNTQTELALVTFDGSDLVSICKFYRVSLLHRGLVGCVDLYVPSQLWG